MGPVEVTINVATAVALLVSVVTDVRSRKILNVVTFPAVGLGLVLGFVQGGWDSGEQTGLMWSLIGAAAGGVPFLLFNAFDAKAFGMGDVKLMAAVGALKGWPFILHALVYTAIVGGVMAIVLLLWKGRLGRTLGGMAKGAARAVKPGKDGEEEGAEKPAPVYVPYGVAIAGGTVWAFVLVHVR